MSADITRLLAGSRSPNNSLVPATDNVASYASNLSSSNLKNSTASVKQPQPEHRSLEDLETHGDIAITLIQNTESIFGKFFDISRLTLGSLLLLLSTFSIVYAITEHRTLMPTSFPNWTLYIILVVSLFAIGVFEGLQIAVVELAHEDPALIQLYYPRGAKLLAWENTGRNVERFLIGRQVSLVLLVFVCARITTFDIWIVDAPNWIINAFMFSGFLGVILVVTVAQLTPQVLAAAYPIEFLNLPGMNIAFGFCLLVESTGIAHAVWLLCVAVKTAVYSCACQYHLLNKQSMRDLKFKMQQSERYGKDMSDIAKDIEMSVEESEKNRDFTINNSKVVVEIESLMQQMDNRPDLFYLYGDDQFAAPSYYYDKFEESGVTIPCFLLPPNHKKHIPPHIVAMGLLKKCVADSKNSRT